MNRADKQDVIKYIEQRKKKLGDGIPKLMKTIKPNKRETTKRQVIGRILELRKLKTYINSLKEERK